MNNVVMNNVVMNNHVIYLQSLSSDFIVQTEPSAEVLYWGKHLTSYSEQTSYKQIAIAFNRPIANSRLDVDVPLSFCPEAGIGVFSSPGLEGHRNGKDWSPMFKTQKVVQDKNSATLISEDPMAQLQLITEIKLDKNGVLQVRNGLTNLDNTPYQVNRLSVTLPLPERAKELMTFNGRWAKEFQPHRVTISHAGYLQENRRGRTSHEYFPGMILGTQSFNEQNGEVWGVHLGWSGNHRMHAAIKSDGRRFIQAEALYLAGEISIAKDETFYTPWLYATYSHQGLNKMSQNFHQFIRQNIVTLVNNKPRPVHLNTWEGIFFDHDPDYIMQMATKAAEIGVERFIIDDGWFGRRDHDKAALGDWFLDKRKYPNGLEPVIKHVKDLGMEFGIWVEPEMINKDSDLYRAHPDWLLQLPNYEQPCGRNQYVLDLQNPAVFEYLVERMSWLFGSYAIDYIKWDMNREIVQPGHKGYPALDGQTKAVYRLFALLREKFPHIEIETCSSGGGRIDFEILKHTQRFWTSDNNDALERQIIQRGISYFFPPEIMGAHIGGAVCHTTYRKHSINLRGLTALFGHMGVELDPVKESKEELEGFTHYIKLHKQLRSLLHSGNSVRLDMDDNSLQGYGVVSQNQQEAVYLVSQLTMPTYALNGHVHLYGLDNIQKYQVELLDMPENINPKISGHTMKRLPGWLENNTILSGDWLESIGLPMPILDPETAMLIKITAV